MLCMKLDHPRVHYRCKPALLNGSTLQAGVIEPTSSIAIRCQVWKVGSMESLDTLRPSSGVHPDWVCMISWCMYL